jgi:hypothetical protein
MSQRGYGTGSIEALRDGDGKTVFQARWRDAAGRRRQKVVASDRRGAERILADIIRQRDLELQGLKPQQFADVTFEELGARYLAEMAPRVRRAKSRRSASWSPRPRRRSGVRAPATSGASRSSRTARSSSPTATPTRP